MCECRYYGKCAGTCDGHGLCVGFGNETYDCDCFSPLPDVDALLTMADEIEDAVRNTNKTTDLAVRFAEIIYTIAKEIRSACGKTGTYVHMVTDDERREVAQRLRGLNGNISHVRRVYEDEGFSILCEDQADYYQICHAVAGYLPAEHMHPCDYEELHARLADLIDPMCKACRDTLFYPDTGLTPEYEETIYRCSACGQVLTYDADFDPETDSPAYCESCGSRVTGIGEPLDE